MAASRFEVSSWTAATDSFFGLYLHSPSLRKHSRCKDARTHQFQMLSKSTQRQHPQMVELVEDFCVSSCSQKESTAPGQHSSCLTSLSWMSLATCEYLLNTDEYLYCNKKSAKKL